MTPGQAWDEFVGSQSVREFLYFRPAGRSIEDFVAFYVEGIPDSVSDIPSAEYWETVDADPGTVTRLLIEYIEDQS